VKRVEKKLVPVKMSNVAQLGKDDEDLVLENGWTWVSYSR